MNLIDLVSTFPSGTDPQIITDTLNAPSIQMVDNTLYSYRALVERFGGTFAAIAMGSLKAAAPSNPLLDATYTSMCSVGIDFSNPTAQAMLTSLVPDVFDANTAATLKQIGIQNISPWQKAGGSGNVDLIAISGAVDNYWTNVGLQQQISNVMQWWTNIHNEVIPQIQSGSVDIAQIKSIVASE